MPMAAKHGRMVNYLEGLLLMKSHDTLTSSLARSCDKLKPFYFVFFKKKVSKRGRVEGSRVSCNSTIFLYNPANIYLFKVNNRNARKRCEIRSKLKVKTAKSLTPLLCFYCLL